MSETRPQSDPRVILADDLTGACDTGVHFARTGLPTIVSWYGQPLAVAALSVICTSSRGLAPDEAAARLRRTARSVLAANVRIVYKKIDSTLKGNLGAEIAATLEELDQSLALVAPAYPRMGRRMVAGQLILGEERRPTGRRVTALLRQQIDSPIHTITLADIRQGLPALTDRIEEILQQEGNVAVADSESDADLAGLAAVIAGHADLVLPVGSAGLAEALARRWQPSCPTTQNIDPDRRGLECGRSRVAAAPLVVVVGSKNRVTSAQIEALLAATPVVATSLPEFTAEGYNSALADGRHFVVKLGWDGSERQQLQRLVDAISLRRPHGVLLTGGDTAEVFCRTAAATGIRLTGEVSPGIVRGDLMGGPLEGLAVVTKAGGFGDKQALVDVMHRLRDRLAHP